MSKPLIGNKAGRIGFGNEDVTSQSRLRWSCSVEGRSISGERGEGAAAPAKTTDQLNVTGRSRLHFEGGSDAAAFLK